MGRNRRRRRQAHGSAWHWKQTDCWYYTLPGTKKRMPLLDEHGQRIRGPANKLAAEMALARVNVKGEEESGGGEWLVARACSDYLQYCERGVAKGTISKGHRDNAAGWLNDLCSYCGAMAFNHYGKEWGQHYQDPLWAAIGSGDGGPSAAASAGRGSRAAARESSSGRSSNKRRLSGKRRAAQHRR